MSRMQIPRRIAILAASIIAIPAARLGGTQTEPTPAITYHLSFDVAEQQLGVRISVTGIDSSRRDIAFELAEWGAWTPLDSLYLRVPRGEPPVRRDPQDPKVLRVQVPDGWDGSAMLAYHIPLAEFDSQLHRREGLLPWIKPADDLHASYALAFANNTLMRVLLDGAPLTARREVTLSAPLGMGVTTGWRGHSSGEQVVTLEHDIDKTPVLFGTPAHAMAESRDGVVYEVMQFSRGPDITGGVLALAQKLTPAYGATTGLPIDHPIRIFITDTGGGQKTDHGLLLQPWHESALATDYKRLIAHELFHEWLGGYAAEVEESTTWFQEGFTDYLAIWHLAGLGEIEWEWVAGWLAELDTQARSTPAFGRVRFGDLTVNWRDGNGPNETLAYKGGAVLAFVMDVELRKAGHPGLPRLIGDLARTNQGRYTLDSIHARMLAHDLGEFFAAYIDKPALPPFPEAMAAAGFDLSNRVETDLTYTGIRIDGDLFGTVKAIDPDGPAAGCGLRVGDVVTGYWPCRSTQPRIDDTCKTMYPFALSVYSLDTEEVNLGYVRDGQEMTAKLRPRRIPGGYLTSYVVNGDRAAKFFELDPLVGTESPHR